MYDSGFKRRILYIVIGVLVFALIGTIVITNSKAKKQKKEIAVTQSLFGLYRYFRRTQFAPTKYPSNIIHLPTIYPGFHQYIAILFGNPNHHE